MKRLAAVLRAGIILIVGVTLLAPTLWAQRNLTTPRQSPHASVSQRIGLSDITIDYARPAVRERAIWGGLVPYGMASGQPFNFNNPFPWRAGANENTTITFTHDVTVQGTAIPAGTYGFHIIPAESGPWTLIFNKDNAAWGSFFYDAAKDQARVTVTPVAAGHREWLQYGFEEITPASVVAYLHWEKMKVPFKIELDVNQIVLENMRTELTNLAGFNSQAWLQAAQYCLQNDFNHAEALAWVDKSMAAGQNVRNMSVKSRLLGKMGKTDEAARLTGDILKEATANGLEVDNNAAGYTYLFDGDAQTAIKIFKINVKKYPQSWNTYDSLADGYHRDGNTKEAISHYQKALDMAPAGQKVRIQGVLEQLKG